MNAEEAEQHFGQVEEHDAASGCNDAEAELLRDLDESGTVGQQEHKERAEGEADGLDCDAGIAGVEDGGQAAEHHAFKQRVDGRGDRGPLLLEDGDHGEDQPAECADHQLRRNAGRIVGLKEGVPRPVGGCQGAEQQNAGFVHGAAEGHARGGVDGAAVPAAGKIAECILAESWIGCLHQGHSSFSIVQYVGWILRYSCGIRDPLHQF